MSFKEIPENEDALLELADNTFLVTAKEWLHADVATFDALDMVWYSPVDGTQFYPTPTHYMEIPRL